MKTFTVCGPQDIMEGFPLVTSADVTHPHVMVGERGPNREGCVLHLGHEDFPQPPDQILRCNLLTTKAKGTKLLVQERPRKGKNGEALPDNRALVFVAVKGGHRGSSELLTDDLRPLTACDDFRGVRLHARGTTRNGLMGTVGGPHEEGIIEMYPNSCFYVRRHGELFGTAEFVCVAWRRDRKSGELSLSVERDDSLAYDEMVTPKPEKTEAE
jgi:hypothetical protein